MDDKNIYFFGSISRQNSVLYTFKKTCIYKKYIRQNRKRD